MEFYVLLLALAKLSTASPTVTPVGSYDFNGLSLVESVATLAANMSKPDGIVQPMKGSPKVLLSCIDPKHLLRLEHVCLENAENIQNLPPIGNCSLADIAGMVGNSSVNFNISEAIVHLEEETSLSSDQILAAAETMGRCIESDFTLFQLLPENLAKLIQMNLSASAVVTHRFGVNRKFDERSNFLRIALCIFKGIIQNGCPEVDALEKKSSLRTIAAPMGDDFSGEFLEDDDDSREDEIDDLN